MSRSTLDGNRGPPLCLWSKEFYETDPSRDFVRGYTFQFGRGIGAGHRGDRQRRRPGACPGARTITGSFASCSTTASG